MKNSDLEQQFSYSINNSQNNQLLRGQPQLYLKYTGPNSKAQVQKICRLLSMVWIQFWIPVGRICNRRKVYVSSTVKRGGTDSAGGKGVVTTMCDSRQGESEGTKEKILSNCSQFFRPPHKGDRNVVWTSWVRFLKPNEFLV